MFDCIQTAIKNNYKWTVVTKTKVYENLYLTEMPTEIKPETVNRQIYTLHLLENIIATETKKPVEDKKDEDKGFFAKLADKVGDKWKDVKETVGENIDLIKEKTDGVIKGAKENNLKNIDVDIPLGCFVCVTGVSGSGKSSLVNEILYKGVSRVTNRTQERPGKFREIKGIENFDKVINIDQSPIGRTPRSNPATYTGLFNDIRDLFASTNDAKIRGYGPGRFSFNVKGGRCEACSGDGLVKIEMHFLADVYVPCEVCKGKRYNRETLEVKYKGKDIAQVLDMTAEEAVEFFENIPRIHKKIQTMVEVGLGYVKLGQSSTTLSGGEAQRVKLATELARTATGRTIYILDEPTTGLHAADVHKLIEVLQQLVEAGNTVLVIEHNLDVIKNADYIVDLGPEGGDGGGYVVAAGTPEEVAATEQSYTGQYLKRYL